MEKKSSPSFEEIREGTELGANKMLHVTAAMKALKELQNTCQAVR